MGRQIVGTVGSQLRGGTRCRCSKWRSVEALRRGFFSACTNGKLWYIRWAILPSSNRIRGGSGCIGDRPPEDVRRRANVRGVALKVRLSSRAIEMPASPIRRLVPYADRAKGRGIKVYHLNIGQPDKQTPAENMNGYG